MNKELDLVAGAGVVPNGATRIVMILDRSGSMAGSESDVIGGFNSFVTSCRAAELEKCTVSYIRFDNVVERVFSEKLADVPLLDSALYAPRGNTALLDAVGQSVAAIASDADDRYIVITFTDGHENASREWTKAKVAALLREREALGNWTFAFFGADIDAWGESGDMGYSSGNSRSHAKSDLMATMEATGRVAAVMSRKATRMTKNYATAAEAVAQHPNLTDEEIELRLADDAPTEARK